MDSELKLLLLEDDPFDADLIQKLLQRSGVRFRAKVVSDEKEFLKALDESSYDAVLADNALPQYSSLEALNIIKKTNPFIAFILVTGTVSEEFAVDIIQRGADDYILKTNLTRLSAALNKAIESKKMQKAKQAAEMEMKELNEELRCLTAHLQKVREEEKGRIAREIHDELGQMLTTIKMDVASADKRLGRSMSEIKGYLVRAIEKVDQTIMTVRRIATELRPGILDDLGLVAALEWQSTEFEKRHCIACKFFSNIEIELEKDIATGFYRIYQEALTNISRHAEATEVNARLDCKEDKLILTIADNGKGFDAQDIKSKMTLGMLGMKERALIMKGELVTESAPGMGTTIVVTVPLQQPDEQEPEC